MTIITLALMRWGSASARARAAERLSHVQGTLVARALVRATRDRDWVVRTKAVQALANHPCDETVDALVLLLKGPDSSVDVVRILGQMRNRRAIGPLEAALTPEPSTIIVGCLLEIDSAWRNGPMAAEVRRSVIARLDAGFYTDMLILELLADPAATRPLLRAWTRMARDHPNSRYDAVRKVKRVLVAIGPPCLEDLREYLFSGAFSSDVLVEAVKEIGGAPKLASLFECYTKDENRFHGKAWLSHAAKLLLKMDRRWEADPSLGALFNQFCEALGDVEPVSDLAVRALGAIGDKRAIPLLIRQFVMVAVYSKTVNPYKKEANEILAALQRINPAWAETAEAQETVSWLNEQLQPDPPPWLRAANYQSAILLRLLGAPSDKSRSWEYDFALRELPNLWKEAGWMRGPSDK